MNGITDGINDYKVKVRAFKKINKNNGYSKLYGIYSSEVRFKRGNNQVIAPTQVTGVKATVNGNVATVSWNSISGATGYEVLYVAPGKEAVIYNVSSMSKEISGITDERNYYNIRVRAYKEINGKKTYGEYSTIVNFKKAVTAPTQVTGVKITVTGTTGTLSWNSVSGADGYEVLYTAPGKEAVTYTFQKTSTNVKNINDERNYYKIQIRAYKEVGGKKTYGEYSSVVSYRKAVTAPAQVIGVKVNVSGTTANLTWNSISGVDGYEVLYTAVGKNPATYVVKTVGGTINGITDERNYYKVQIRAYKEIDGKKTYGAYSSVVSFKKVVTPPAQVTGLKGTLNGTTENISWNSVSGANGYETIFVKPNNLVVRKNQTGTAHTVTGVTNDIDYCRFQVRAYKEDANKVKTYGTASNVLSFRGMTKPAQVKNVKATISGTTITILWDSASYAQSYEILFTTPGAQTKKFTSNTTGINLTGLPNVYGQFLIQVRAVRTESGNKVYGDYSGTYGISKNKSNIAQVTGVKANISTGGIINISWNRVTSASGYEIVYYEAGKQIGIYTSTTNAKTITHAGIDLSKARYIYVRAYFQISGSRTYGLFSSVVSFSANTKPAQVSNAKATVNGSNATITWSGISGVNGYEVILTPPGKESITYDVTGTSKAFGGIIDKVNYYRVQVRAYKLIGGNKLYGKYSNEVSFRGN